MQRDYHTVAAGRLIAMLLAHGQAGRYTQHGKQKASSEQVIGSCRRECFLCHLLHFVLLLQQSACILHRRSVLLKL